MESIRTVGRNGMCYGEEYTRLLESQELIKVSLSSLYRENRSSYTAKKYFQTEEIVVMDMKAFSEQTGVSLGKDGYPIPGKVVKLYRERMMYVDPIDGKQKHWTQENLAERLGITKLMVRLMETQNKGLDSIERRKLLCTLLKIPPALLGLSSLEQVTETFSVNTIPEESHPLVVKQNENRGIEAYKAILTQYNLYHSKWSAQTLIVEIELLLQKLREDIKNISSKQEKKQHLYMLWEFYRLAAKIYGDDKPDLFRVNQHLNNALSIALELQDANLHAITLAHSCGIKLLQQNAYLARIDIDAALAQLKNASPVVKCDVLGLAASTYAASQKDLGDIMSARSFLEQSQAILAKSIVKDERYIPDTLNIFRCQLTQFNSFLDLRRIPDALELLDTMDKTEYAPSQGHKGERGKALLSLNRSKCYMALRHPDYDQAVQLLSDSFTIFRNTGTLRHIEEIKKIYHQIRKSPYSNNPEVVDLELVLQNFHASPLARH